MKLFLKNRCYNGGSKHKFKPRYDEVPNNKEVHICDASAEETRSLIYYNVYLFDICIWCGEKVEKK